MTGKETSQGFLTRLWSDIISSVLFLSRLPLTAFASAETPDFARSSYTFPLAGLLVALPAALCLVVADAAGLPVIVTSVLVVVVMIVATGALHEDGLADVADGFWGGHTKERKLEIMRDSAIGTYGTLALVLSVFLRIALISALIGELGGLHAAMMFVAAASLSRLAVLYVWIGLPAARALSGASRKSSKRGKEGESLSAKYGIPTKATAMRSIVLALPVVFLSIWFAGPIAIFVAAVFSACAIWLVKKLAESHIGGHTGDVLGATQQMSELGLYLGLVMAI